MICQVGSLRASGTKPKSEVDVVAGSEESSDGLGDGDNMHNGISSGAVVLLG